MTIPNTPASLQHSAEVPLESSYRAAHSWEFHAALASNICVRAQFTDRST